MLSEISSRDFAEWLAYSRLEPWGEERDDLRMGIIAATIANANRGKNQKAYKPADFIPDFEPESDEQASARIMAQVMAALGGKR